MLKQTPLIASHKALQAKCIDFHGWEMPLQYESPLKEQHAVRNHVGIFDVSHMTILDILGAGGRQFLRKLLSNDVDKIKHIGRAIYSCMCNEHGCILDDLMVYQRTPDNYRLVLNAATRKTVLPWIQNKSLGFSVGLQARTDLAMIAIQGPKAIETCVSILNPSEADAVLTLGRFDCSDVEETFFARTGYTGEDGLEVMLPKQEANVFWDKCIQAGMTPCGLAARDILRLEAGFLLYGQDMDDTKTPLNSNLEWTVSWEPQDRDFIGMHALISQKANGIKEKLIGIKLPKNGVLRHDQKVMVNDTQIGTITSGTYSPNLNCSVALARVSCEQLAAAQAQGAELSVVIRDKTLMVEQVSTRFLNK